MLGKIAMIGPEIREFIPSDCVISLETNSVEVSAAVRNRLVDNWSKIRTVWQGSCAPYTTIAKLQAALKEIGITCVDQRPELPNPSGPLEESLLLDGTVRLGDVASETIRS